MWSKWSWTVFVLIGGMGAVMGARMFFSPDVFVEMVARVGPRQPEVLTSGDALRFIDFMGRWTATALIGVNVITLVVACTALRRRERWAAYAMLYWPAMFVSHFAMYETGPMTIMQLVFFAMSSAAIATVLLPGAARASAPAPA